MSTVDRARERLSRAHTRFIADETRLERSRQEVVAAEAALIAAEHTDAGIKTIGRFGAMR